MAGPKLKPLALTLATLAWVAEAAAQQDGTWVQRAQEAATALQRGNVDQALQFYTDALADRTLSNDRRGMILNDRGVAFARKQQHRAAIDDFNHAVQLYPEHAPTYNNRGNVLLQLGQPREAIRDFDRAIVLAPNYSAAFANRASAWLLLADSDKAVVEYTRAIELSTQNASAFNGRGKAHLAANRPHAASRDFSRAVQINAGFAAAYRNRAAARSMVDRPEEAIEDLSRALAFEPRFVEGYVRRGEAYLAAGNPANALKDFNKALELAPQSAAAFVGRGLAHGKAEAFDEGLNDLAQAIELDPRMSRAYAIRAWLYKQTQQPELGQKDVERALKLEAVTADAFWAQGEVEEALGRGDTAATAYGKAVAADPRHRDALAGLQRLGLKSYREDQEVADAGVERWRVIANGTQYFAVNDTIAKLRVPLETYGSAVPRLLEWDRRKPPFAGIGVLRYAAGGIEGIGDIESAAIVDMQAPGVIATQLHRIGAKTATWTWSEGRLVVAGADGMSEELSLRPQKAKDGAAVAAVEPAPEPAPRRVSANASQGSRESRPPPRQQKPKSLFELIFGN